MGIVNVILDKVMLTGISLAISAKNGFSLKFIRENVLDFLIIIFVVIIIIVIGIFIWRNLRGNPIVIDDFLLPDELKVRG
ncbi:MAG: hypothetical protein OEV44_12340, partial [Spirochaetota bacterium]|nr:hypothetical protein [Spirochaetota bacterium]